MSSLSILIGVVVVLAIAGTTYLFRSELGNDHKVTEENVQNNPNIETTNKAIEINKTDADIEVKKIQGLKLTPTVAEADNLQVVDTTIETTLSVDDKAQEQEVNTTDTATSANENIEDEKTVEAIEAVSNQQSQPIKAEISVKEAKDEKPTVNETETKEKIKEIVTEENKPKDHLSQTETIDSDQSDSIKAAIQQQIKKSKQMLKLLVDHEDR